MQLFVLEYLFDGIDSKENMVMVGDTIYDVEGAKYHGIPAIGVSWGYGSVQEMIDAGAAAIANTTEEVIALLNQ